MDNRIDFYPVARFDCRPDASLGYVGLVTRVLVGLGSNMGASVDIVERALAELRALSGAGFRASSLWRTSPVDCPPGSGDFVNAVALLVVDSTAPEPLLRDLKAMERRYGRDEAPVRNAPRELDLDLLLFGDEERRSDLLMLPHPRANTRRFVMVPAAEVAPDWIWPGTGRSISEIAESLSTAERLVRISPADEATGT